MSPWECPLPGPSPHRGKCEGAVRVGFPVTPKEALPRPHSLPSLQYGRSQGAHLESCVRDSSDSSPLARLRGLGL